MRRLGKLRDATKALLDEIEKKIEEKEAELEALRKEQSYLEKKLLEQ